MPSLSSSLRRHCCFSSLQLAETHLQRAKQLISTQKREDVEIALVSIEAALELSPQLDKALELKARALLYLKRFREVAEMLHDHIPSLMSQTFNPPDSPLAKEKTRLLSDYIPQEDLDKSPILKYLSVAKLREKLSAKLSEKSEREQWKYLVLGQACCHLGMMEDAMILLQSGKRTASAVSRRQSNWMRDDNFCSERMTPAETDLVNHMLGNIKFLLRRRSAASAALEAGLYSESVRHFSKILEGRKGTPQGFLADCYLHRAIAYQATGKVADAIADCNRALALNPNCARALSARASLYEMVRCFSACLLDLQQLKMVYEAALRYQMVPEPRRTIRQQNASDTDFAGGLEYINSKITTTRQRLSGGCSIDAHAILDLPRNCTLADVEKAFLLISLKHRPDKAAHFVDRCGFVDDRDVETVKDEARSSAIRLSQLIQKAYNKLLSTIVEEETEKKDELQLGGLEVAFIVCSSEEGVRHSQAISERDLLDDKVEMESFEWEGKDDDEELNSYLCDKEEESKMVAMASINDGSMTTGKVVLEAFTGFDYFSLNNRKELKNNNIVTDLANVEAIISKALCPCPDHSPIISQPSSAWISAPDWSLLPLPVT